MGASISTIYNIASMAIYQQTRELMLLQEQISTGSRINRSSDDPSGGYRVLSLESDERMLSNYIDNLTQTMDLLEFSSTAVEDTKSALANAKNLLSQITSGASGSSGIQVTIEGINDALDRVVAAANTKHSGKYIFGGSDTATQPYAVTKIDGRITSVTYQGSTSVRDVEVAPGIDATSYYVGDDLFRCDSRSEPVFTGLTGAAAGTSTSSVRGDVWMEVTHDGSNYHISIDGGLTDITVPAGGQANQMVTDSRTGEVLYVDTTGINQTGTEWVKVPGTYDVFNTLITLRDRLETAGGLTTAEMEELRYNAFDAIDALSENLIQKSVMIGSKIGFLDNLKESLETVQYTAQDEITRIEEADVAQLSIDMSRREILYQMSLAMVGKLLNVTLMDYL
ncbi:MAG: flagellar hook-associated protein FlgL [Sedimentisphaerales bacterium]|nr:flagellar hook-associated protein FlgL [Sedimentisphaerales bacterium]